MRREWVSESVSEPTLQTSLCGGRHAALSPLHGWLLHLLDPLLGVMLCSDCCLPADKLKLVENMQMAYTRQL